MTGRGSEEHGKKKTVWKAWNSANFCVALPRHMNLV
jgi:hypothetical protein